jgi:hypothetical protein
LPAKFSIQGILFVGGPAQINTTLDYQQELNLTVTNFTSAENLFVLGKFYFLNINILNLFEEKQMF